MNHKNQVYLFDLELNLVKMFESQREVAQTFEVLDEQISYTISSGRLFKRKYYMSHQENMKIVPKKQNWNKLMNKPDMADQFMLKSSQMLDLEAGFYLLSNPDHLPF